MDLPWLHQFVSPAAPVLPILRLDGGRWMTCRGLSNPKVGHEMQKIGQASATQIGGDHYLKLKLQPWQVIDACGLNFYEGTAIAYIMRRKGDRVEDLQKAIHTLEHLIELEKGDASLEKG
jgi:hypothetical protein